MQNKLECSFLKILSSLVSYLRVTQLVDARVGHSKVPIIKSEWFCVFYSHTICLRLGSPFSIYYIPFPGCSCFGKNDQALLPMTNIFSLGFGAITVRRSKSVSPLSWLWILDKAESNRTARVRCQCRKTTLKLPQMSS
jgi:hypothetical protein